MIIVNLISDRCGDSYPLTIFYDGACPMCVRQMEKFRQRDTKKRLMFIDVSRPDFNAQKFGLDGMPLQRYIYAKDAEDRVVRGVDAFVWMWRASDRRILAWFVGLPVVKQLGKLLYRFISRFRYRLFGKNENVCDFHCAKEI